MLKLNIYLNFLLLSVSKCSKLHRRSRTIAGMLSGSQTFALFLFQYCFMRRLTVIYWQADLKPPILIAVFAGCWRGDIFQEVLYASE